ncbi:MAG: hypothetical protein R3A10_23680 [Caldilineaceae bacterium]
MTDVEIPPELEQDPVGHQHAGAGLGRDPERTPMQWSAEPACRLQPARHRADLAACGRELRRQRGRGIG